MGYSCPHCGEGLPQGEERPCQVIDEVLDDLRPGRAAKLEQDRPRRILTRAAGPVESITATEIGERDDWVCGICQDTMRLAGARPDAPRALSPSIDHIIPVPRGGTHTRSKRADHASVVQRGKKQRRACVFDLHACPAVVAPGWYAGPGGAPPQLLSLVAVARQPANRVHDCAVHLSRESSRRSPLPGTGHAAATCCPPDGRRAPASQMHVRGPITGIGK